MALYARLTKTDPPDPNRIGVHLFMGILDDWARGRITNTQAQNACTAASNAPLTAGEVTELNTLLGTITSIAVPAAPAPLGSNATANQLRDYTLAWSNRNQGLAQRSLRVLEIEHVLNLAGNGIPPYNTAAAVQTRLTT